MAEATAHPEGLGRRSQGIAESDWGGCLGIGMSEMERWPGRLDVA